MRREYAPIAAMAALLVASQAVAIALSPLFKGSGFQAFPNPSDVTNTAIYIVLILVFTAVILGLVRYRRQNLAKYVIMASVFITLAFVLLLPLFYGLYYGTGENQDPNFQNLLGNVATLLSFAVAAVLVYLLVKFPEWYVVDTIGFVTAAGVTAILGISFGLLPAILLLVALAVYDAWAVYRTKHMITLADELTSQRLPILLVIPKKAGYSFREQKSLKGQIAAGEEREAMFIGLGDLIIPGILSVSAFTFLNDPALLGRSLGPVAPFMTVALGTVIGSLVGFFVLMRYVLKGNPQAGLPLLNGGALLGFLATSLLVYGTIHLV
ncbi:MAG TPA: presenilin family intramembrane aspartyl protease PSH [Thermoplasmata archaeon]|nr:presenilin family intramembrane aspartyl protease PSH [Thermoplasmata archaeon]